MLFREGGGRVREGKGKGKGKPFYGWKGDRGREERKGESVPFHGIEREKGGLSAQRVGNAFKMINNYLKKQQRTTPLPCPPNKHVPAGIVPSV